MENGLVTAHGPGSIVAALGYIIFGLVLISGIILLNSRHKGEAH